LTVHTGLLPPPVFVTDTTVGSALLLRGCHDDTDVLTVL
jgi:hypothetical protein